MFELALKAQIPFISIETDDLVHLETVLKSISGMSVRKWNKSKLNLGPYLYWTDTLDDISVELYKNFLDTDHQLIFVNIQLHYLNLIFPAGKLNTPQNLVKDLLKEVLTATTVDNLIPALKGLSLKNVGEVIKLAQAKFEKITPETIKQTRGMLCKTGQGLIQVDTYTDFYVFPTKLKEWLDLNSMYFLKETHPKLIPRGVLLEGSPGVGKSMAAKAIASHLKIPLYRLDVATTLGKYVGESEARFTHSLASIEQESPCILLLDEVEKIFSQNDDSGVIHRLLSQLLWWLSEHKSRVFTVMTTNNLAIIPAELYRSGRVDLVMKIPKLSYDESREFSYKVYFSIFEKEPVRSHVATLNKNIKNTGADDFSHAELTTIVFNTIKKENWYGA